MKLGFFQFDVIGRDREANLSYITTSLINSKFDLLVLPELFTSGYAFDHKDELLPFAEDLNDSITVEALTKIAVNSEGFISGTIPELYNGKIYNTAILVGKEGLVGMHRKIHLPDYEKRFFAEGNDIETFDCDGTKVGMMVCFDCWFAPLSAKLKLQQAQIVCHSANFSGPVTPSIISVRALENQFFVISCNRIGTELFDGEPDSYRGESRIVNPDGKVILQAGGKEKLAFVHIDIEEVNHAPFANLITKDFLSEHNKYNIEIDKN